VFDRDDLIFASDSERYSKIKNDPDLNMDLISEALSLGGEPQLICWYENPYKKILRQLIAGQGFKFVENNVRRYLRRYDIKGKIKYQNHHHSHAAAGYYTSPYDNATVVCVDSIGEFETITVWKAQGNILQKIHRQSYPHSLGLWYSAMTQRIGLKPNEEEYILMGMAALGDPYRFYFDIYRDFFRKDSQKGKLRFAMNLHRGCKWWRPELQSQQDLFDIAAAVQKIYEDVFYSIIEYSKKLNPSDNLVLMGGCALNCVANSLAFEFYDNVWIMPAPGDNGSSIGSVLAYKQRKIHWPGAYLGHDLGYETDNNHIVDYLLDFGICGLARGRAEFGPRALGNRSLIADPRLADIKDRVNAIKKRELFRPFSPAIQAESADKYFDMPTGSSPYMQYTARCRYPEKYPAIVHFDGTSRVQTVTSNDNPQFRDLLEKWFVRTGCPMLLNTSLNIKGQPMLNDRKDVKDWEDRYGLPIFT
jgi:carbamoyltransferase